MINRFYFNSENGKYWVYDAQEVKYIDLPTTKKKPLDKAIEAVEQFLKIIDAESKNSVWPYKKDSLGFVGDQSPDEPKPIERDSIEEFLEKL